MPEHVHLLIWPQREDYSISAILTSIKKPVTNAALRHIRRTAPEFLNFMRDEQPNENTEYRFWQRGGGYDRNLWTPKDIWEKIVYIHRNPVRRGLAKQMEEWPWSSVQDYLNLREAPLILDRASLPASW